MILSFLRNYCCHRPISDGQTVLFAFICLFFQAKSDDASFDRLTYVESEVDTVLVHRTENTQTNMWLLCTAHELELLAAVTAAVIVVDQIIYANYV